MGDESVFDRLLAEEDAFSPAPGLPAWETHGNFTLLVTGKGIAILMFPVDESPFGIVRFPTGDAVRIPPGPPHEIMTRAESILAEGRSVWEHLELDRLDPEKAKSPEPAPQETDVPEPPRTPPVRTGQSKPILKPRRRS